MFQRTITVQSSSTIMAMGWFSRVKLLPLVDRTSPPTSLASVIRTISPSGRGTPRQFGGGNLLLQLPETFFLSGGPTSRE